MLSIPINVSTFKKSFLGGDGSLEISTDQDAWKVLNDTGRPFSKDVQDLVDLKFSTGTSKDFQFGQKNKLTLNVSFNSEVGGRIDLIWPEEDNEIIKKYNLTEFLTPDKLYMAILFNAKASAGVEGGFPVGPLSANFGISAGGHVGYERLVPYDQAKPVREILADLFGGTRLPQSITAVDEIPAKGEVLATNYGGYLNLSAGLNWGYSMTGTRSFEAKDLKLELDYALRLMASVSVGYRLAGDFNFETRAGALPGWVNYRVTKKRQSKLNFVADFGFTAKADLNGLPESADEFLAALFGADAKTALGYLAKAEKYSSVEELEKAVGKLAKGFLQDLSDKLIGKALSNATLVEFLAAVKKVTDTYNGLEQRMVDLYTDYLDKIPRLNSTLDQLLALSSFEGLKGVTNAESWEIIKRLSGERFYDLLLNQQDFQQFLVYVRSVKSFINDGATQHIRDFIAELKKSLPLDDLFKELEKCNTPDKLKAMADEKLQALVEKLVGNAFDQLGDYKKASQQVNAALKQISKFKDKWYEKVTEAVHQTFEFNLHSAYTRATEDDALIDLEINLNEAAGRELSVRASVGDFAEVLKTYDPTLVRINPDSVFKRKLTAATQLQINVFGWGYKRLTELLQNIEHAIETEKGGLMHVFTIETQIKQLSKMSSRKKLIESIQSNFLLRTVGESFQPIGSGQPTDPATGRYIIRTLTNMGVQYQMLYRDDRTKAEELTKYFDLATFLGLIPSSSALIAELNSQFPDGLGKVTVDYVVRYDDKAVRNAFTLSSDELAEWARQTARQVIGAKYTGMKETGWVARVGFAYQSPAFYQLYRKGFTALLNEGKAVTLPGWFTGGSPQTVALDMPLRNIVLTLFNIEKKYAERLVAFDAIVERSIQKQEPIPLDELQKASREFVGMSDDLDSFGRENSFFAMFDKLVHVGSSGKWRRQSAMVLNIQPPDGEPVTKYLMG